VLTIRIGDAFYERPGAAWKPAQKGVAWPYDERLRHPETTAFTGFAGFPATDACAGLPGFAAGFSVPSLWAWCLDEGDWQFAKPAAGSGGFMLTLKDLQNGPHVCRIRGHDGLLRATPERVHRFEVRRDTDREITAAVARLQSASFAEREDAARVLRGIGAAVLPALRHGIERADPDTRWWFRALIEEIGRKGGK